MSGQHRLLSLVSTHFDDSPLAYRLLDEFLGETTYSRRFCLKLLAAAKEKTETPWVGSMQKRLWRRRAVFLTLQAVESQ